MILQQASLTAKGAAVHRALESEKPADRRVCYDPLARKFIGEDFTACGKVFLPQWLALYLFQMGFPGFHDYFAARTRHFDEYLNECLKEGVKQVVILGAGYDSRALRMDRLKSDINVFEVDAPATQQDKILKLKKILNRLPHHLKFVSIDFNTQDLTLELLENGYKDTLKTLFIWEGVTYYLEANAVEKTLAFVKDRSGPESSIIFDYTYPGVIEGRCSRIEAMNWHMGLMHCNETISFGLNPDKIHLFLSHRGFHLLHNADYKWLQHAYFKGINQERSITPIFAIVKAKVA